MNKLRFEWLRKYRHPLVNESSREMHVVHEAKD